MLNKAIAEGYVTKKIWPYDGDMFFRLAVYRDPDREIKVADRGPDERHKPDYFTVRLPASLEVAVEAGQRVQIDGWLESREFDDTLADFLNKSRGDRKPRVDPQVARQVVKHRTSTWLVADRIIVIPNGGGNQRSKTRR